MEPKKTILVIEDEPQIVLGLKDALEFEGFRVISADNGKSGISLAKQERPNVVLLDLMLPDVNGYQVCEELRRHDAFMPIIMLTARSQEADKIRGLDVGADDYVTKPFSVGELVARIRAIFRRMNRSPQKDAPIQVGDAEIDPAAQVLRRGRSETKLSFYEVQLLKLLFERAGQPVSRDEILDKVWGIETASNNRTVDNFVVKLRKKVEPQPEEPRHILTVYGVGYKLVV